MPVRKMPASAPRISLDVALAADQLPEGLFSVIVNGEAIDFQYEYHGYETTGIFFQAAVSKKVQALPVFLGQSVSAKASMNRLFVSDPTLHSNPRLTLGWYAGSSSLPKLQRILSLIFLKVSRGKRALYFGTSGGGFAALLYSALHPYSIAIPVNPQTNIAAYDPKAVARWTDLAWGMNNENMGTRVLPSVRTNLLDLYSQPLTNTVVYLQNTGDSYHMESHFAPFKMCLHPANQFHELLVHVAEGHIAPAPAFTAELLDMASAAPSWRDLKLETISTSPARK